MAPKAMEAGKKRSGFEVSGAKGLFVILGVMLGFMGVMAIVASAVSP